MNHAEQFEIEGVIERLPALFKTSDLDALCIGDTIYFR